MSVGWSVGPNITLNVIFSTISRRIDLKFGGDLPVNLLFQIPHFFFSAPPLTPSPQNLILFISITLIISLGEGDVHNESKGQEKVGMGRGGWVENGGNGKRGKWERGKWEKREIWKMVKW